ncbi:TolC family protein [Endothiovibrio diazotrophicus]
MSPKPLRLVAALLVGLVLIAPTLAAADQTPAPQPLPQPLTLGQALEFAGAEHPQLAAAEARRAAGEAGVRQAEADDGIHVSMTARARWIEPSEVAGDQSSADHSAYLLLRKRLYDFGLTEARVAAAEAEAGAGRWGGARTLRERREAIMEAFFDVLLADLQYARDNEEMAVQYVALDKLRDRREQGQVSDLEVLEQDSRFQAIRRQVRADDGDRRLTRAHLALALGRPGELPADLIRPELPQVDRDPPELEVALAAALEHAPALAALGARVEAAEARLRAARAGNRPVLSAEVEAAGYSRELGSRDPLRAGLVLEAPLYSGGRVDADAARAHADLQGLRAELEQARYRIREEVRGLWEEIATLRVQREEAQTLADYRELYLDRSRALYEMEVKTDLGDAMTRDSEARLLRARTDFRLALAWERLDALTTPAEEKNGQD